MPPVIEENRCISCGKCVYVCQSDVFFGTEEGKIPNVTYPDECWHCNACVSVCPIEGAVKLRIPLPMMVLYKRR